MRKVPPLTDKKRKWAENRKVALRGNRLNYNASLQAKYIRELEKLVRQMVDEVKKQSVKLFESDLSENFFKEQQEAASMDASLASQARILTNALTEKFMKLFSLKSKPLAENMVDGTAAVSTVALHGSLKQLSGGLSLKTGVVPKGMEDISTSLVAENVSLIKSIPEQYLKNVTGAIMRSITTGNGLMDLVPELNKYSGQTSRRVKNLALDQTRKAYIAINKQKMMSLGVKTFEWSHSHGGQSPRESHLKIDGHIFSFENLQNEQAALGVPPEDRGLPGFPINCKCTIVPVIKFGEE